VDLKRPEFGPSAADDFQLLDLREQDGCEAALAAPSGGVGFDVVYQLAADMGGMGFHPFGRMRHHAQQRVDQHQHDSRRRAGGHQTVFLLFVCVHLIVTCSPGEPELKEAEAYPALPDNEYGLGKAVRRADGHGIRPQVRHRRAASRDSRTVTARRARGRVVGKRRPPLICRKVAEAVDGGTIEVWGDGTAIRSYTYVDDMVDGIYRLTDSSLEGPANIGSPSMCR